jgi:uncharacterized protein YggE
MRTPIRLSTFLFFASLAFAQLDANSVTVSVSRSTSLQPDQAVFGVTVTSGMDTSLNDVVAALQSSGITIANFIGVSNMGGFNGVLPPTPGPPSFQPMLGWVFGLPVPISKIKDTAAMLSSLQQSIGKNGSGLTLSFSVQGTQVSAAMQQAQACSTADLVSDARVQAQKLAASAGMSVGNILAMSSGIVSVTQSSGVFVGIPIAGLFPSSAISYPIGAPCTATVKFAVK